MNANIFENNEDLLDENTTPNHSPSIFEDFQNPLQASIAVSYYRWKQEKAKNETGESKLTSLFKAAERQARLLA